MAAGREGSLWWPVVTVTGEDCIRSLSPVLQTPSAPDMAVSPSKSKSPPSPHRSLDHLSTNMISARTVVDDGDFTNLEMLGDICKASSPLPTPLPAAALEAGKNDCKEFQVWALFRYGHENIDFICKKVLHGKPSIYCDMEFSKPADAKRLSVMQAMETIGQLSCKTLAGPGTLPMQLSFDVMPKLSVTNGRDKIEDFESDYPSDSHFVVITRHEGFVTMYSVDKNTSFGQSLYPEFFKDSVHQSRVMSAEDVCNIIKKLNSSIYVGPGTKICYGFELNIESYDVCITHVSVEKLKVAANGWQHPHAKCTGLSVEEDDDVNADMSEIQLPRRILSQDSQRELSEQEKNNGFRLMHATSWIGGATLDVWGTTGKQPIIVE